MKTSYHSLNAGNKIQYATFSTSYEELKPYPPASSSCSFTTTFQNQFKASSDFIFFSKAYPLLTWQNKVNLHDLSRLLPLPSEMYTSVVTRLFMQHYEQSGRSLLWAILTAYRDDLVKRGLGGVIIVGCQLFFPIVLHRVIQIVSLPKEEVPLGLLAVWLLTFFLSKVLEGIVVTQKHFHMECTAIQLTGALQSLLFRKVLWQRRYHFPVRHEEKEEEVEISNIIASDIDNIQWASGVLNEVWLLPLRVIILVYFLYGILGTAPTIGGCGVILLCTFATYMTSREEQDEYKEIMTAKDRRMKVLKELLKGILRIKLNTWEMKKLQELSTLRRIELDCVSRMVYWGAANVFILWASPVFVSICSFGVYVWVQGKTLTAAKVFTSIALFNALRDPLFELPEILQHLLQAKVSLERLERFLRQDEYDPLNVCRDGTLYPYEIMIKIKNVSLGWARSTVSNTKEQPVLKSISLEIKRGQLVVVHGPIGSGKTALCSALLGEMYIHKTSRGHVFVRGGRIAYCSQEPWVQQGLSIRENILFGSQKYDKVRYMRVLEACGLSHQSNDLTVRTHPHQHLSRSLLKRICLARACYSDADILILDEPFAGLDHDMQQSLFNDCLCGLMRDKTILLVTQNDYFIKSKQVDMVLLLEDGHLSIETQPLDEPSSMVRPQRFRKKIVRFVDQQDQSPLTTTIVEESVVDDEEQAPSSRHHVVTLWRRYIKATGGLKALLWLCFLQIVWQCFQIASDFWLSDWTSSHQVIDYSWHSYYMLVYTLLACGSALMVFTRVASVTFMGLRASHELFQELLTSILYAPVRFFTDQVSIGSMLYLFGQDISILDYSLPFSIGTLIGHLFFVFCQFATTLFAVGMYGLFTLPMIYFYIEATNCFLPSSRNLIRLYKKSLASLLDFVVQCERKGVETIRAFGRNSLEKANQENMKRIDTSSQVWYAEAMMNQWFAMRIQLIGTALVIIIVSCCIYLREVLSPGMVGLVFSYIVSVDAALATLMKSWNSIDMEMISTEQVIKYTKIESERKYAVLQSSTLSPTSNTTSYASIWPTGGGIRFENVQFKYKDIADLTLKDISFHIKQGEKVTVVGATGAGKSSLLMALCRIQELTAGRILIDGVDIAGINLQKLRASIGILSSSPIVFKGTVRTFLDPYGSCEDVDVWRVLELCSMKVKVLQSKLRLEQEIHEYGENWSTGERQMLCLAQILLQKNARIVVVDDEEGRGLSKQRVDALIRQAFPSATLIRMTKELPDVLEDDSDRIMILQDGQLKSFDSNRNIL